MWGVVFAAEKQHERSEVNGKNFMTKSKIFSRGQGEFSPARIVSILDVLCTDKKKRVSVHF